MPRSNPPPLSIIPLPKFLHSPMSPDEDFNGFSDITFPNQSKHFECFVLPALHLFEMFDILSSLFR